MGEPRDNSTLSSKVYETIYTNNIHFNKGDNTNILNGCIVTSGPDFFRKLGLPMKDTGRVYVEGNHAGEPVFCPDINSKEDIPEKMLEYFNESYRFLSKYVGEENVVYAGVKQIRFHDFRHSCASLLINKGANIQVVAKYLGHTNIEETLKTYSHLFISTLDEIINVIDTLEDNKTDD